MEIEINRRREDKIDRKMKVDKDEREYKKVGNYVWLMN